MANFTKWIKQAVDKLVDPEKDSRVSQLVQAIRRDLYQKKQKFVLAESVHGLEFRAQDLEAAKRQVYQDLLCRVWQDGTLSDGERQVATWAGKSLQLNPAHVRETNTQFAKHILRRRWHTPWMTAASMRTRKYSFNKSPQPLTCRWPNSPGGSFLPKVKDFSEESSRHASETTRLPRMDGPG
jgi:hypothetical protein